MIIELFHEIFSVDSLSFYSAFIAVALGRLGDKQAVSQTAIHADVLKFSHFRL
jgi:hypothetical protein